MSALEALAAEVPPNNGGRRPLIDGWPDDVRAAIVAARRVGASHRQIAEAATADGRPISAGAVREWLRRQGVG